MGGSNKSTTAAKGAQRPRRSQHDRSTDPQNKQPKVNAIDANPKNSNTVGNKPANVTTSTTTQQHQLMPTTPDPYLDHKAVAAAQIVNTNTSSTLLQPDLSSRPSKSTEMQNKTQHSTIRTDDSTKLSPAEMQKNTQTSIINTSTTKLSPKVLCEHQIADILPSAPNQPAQKRKYDQQDTSSSLSHLGSSLSVNQVTPTKSTDINQLNKHHMPTEPITNPQILDYDDTGLKQSSPLQPTLNEGFPTSHIPAVTPPRHPQQPGASFHQTPLVTLPSTAQQLGISNIINPYAKKRITLTPFGQSNSQSFPACTTPKSHRVLLIKDLDINTKSPWAIHALILDKEEITFYSGKQGTVQQQRFSFTIIDESNVTIKATCFTNAVRRFYTLIQPKKVYVIQNCIVQESRYNDKYSSNYELVVYFKSDVHEHPDTSSKEKHLLTLHPPVTNIVEIANLTLTTYHWAIHAYVSYKSPIKEYPTKSGMQGRLFTINMVDKSNIFIQGTFFTNAVEKFYDMIHVGNCYSFTNANLLTPDKQYSSAGIEIKFNENSIIQPIDDPSLKNKLSNKFTVILDIQPRNFNNWPLCARVIRTNKVTQWENQNKEGLIFSAILFDSSGFDINATFFDQAATTFSHLLQPGQIYLFSGGSVKDSKYLTNCTSPYDITFPLTATIQKVSRDTENIITSHPTMFNFTTLSNILQNPLTNKKFDLLAVVLSVGELITFSGHQEDSSTQNSKCELTIVDQSGSTTTLTVWNDQALHANTHYHHNPIVGFCPVTLTNFNGTTSLTNVGQLVDSPSCPAASELLTWWKTTSSLSTQHNILQLFNTNDNDQQQSPPTTTTSDLQFTSISLLTNNTPDWNLCGRVYRKSPVVEKDHNNTTTTTGKTFLIHIIDSSGYDICGTFSGSTNVDHYYPLLQTGSIYSFSKGFLQKSLPSYSGCASNFTIHFNMSSLIVPLISPSSIDSNPNHPLFAYHFQKLDQLSSLKGSDIKADVVAVVKTVGEVISSSTGDLTSRCDLIIVDESNVEVKVTIWNDDTTDSYIRFAGNPIVAFLPVRVKKFAADDKITEVSAIGQVLVSPRCSRSNDLALWWMTGQTDNSIEPIFECEEES